MSIPFRLQSKPYIVAPCKQPLRLLYQDEHLLVLDKPSGLLTQPGRDPRNHDSVLSRVQCDFAQPYIVHRLDLDTSGLMMLALNKSAAGDLGRQLEQRRVQKRYHAVCHGQLAANHGHIRLPIVVNWPRRPLQHVCWQAGKPSHTEYRVVHQASTAATVELMPHTGRSHQLRLHMASIGHPLLGCDFYAPDAVCYAAPRLLLHASVLSFAHPVSGEALCFNSPAPFLNAQLAYSE